MGGGTNAPKCGIGVGANELVIDVIMNDVDKFLMSPRSSGVVSGKSCCEADSFMLPEDVDVPDDTTAGFLRSRISFVWYSVCSWVIVFYFCLKFI